MLSLDPSSKASRSLFGRVSLGYLAVESRKTDEWSRFLAEGLGLHVDTLAPGEIVARVDSYQRRLIVCDGNAEDVVAIGWQMSDLDALTLAVARLSRLGIEVEEGTAAEAALRGVQRLWYFVGPKALRTELFVDAVLSEEPLRMKANGFVTGTAGLGHVAITTRQPEAMQAFWKQVFDARLSDEIEDKIDGVNLAFSFLRLNERHHSLATAATRGIRLNPFRTQIHHMNLQCASLEDVIQGYLRCRALGSPIAHSIGQHPNDRELSFYVQSPSGFELELGWNPLEVEERTWRPTSYQGISLWGHRPENLSILSRLARIRQGLASLMHPEFTVQGKRK
jgi:2,3-dihydroxybiphenyl 1,2-dioxygenase